MISVYHVDEGKFVSATGQEYFVGYLPTSENLALLMDSVTKLLEKSISIEEFFNITTLNYNLELSGLVNKQINQGEIV